MLAGYVAGYFPGLFLNLYFYRRATREESREAGCLWFMLWAFVINPAILAVICVLAMLIG